MYKRQFNYSKNLIEKSQSLRKESTKAENLLWYYLRGRRFNGLKFRRQVPMGNYIVDFLCLEKNMIVELDGSQHLDQMSYDLRRTLWLEAQGYVVLRFWNNQVLGSLEQVLDVLWSVCN